MEIFGGGNFGEQCRKKISARKLWQISNSQRIYHIRFLYKLSVNIGKENFGQFFPTKIFLCTVAIARTRR